MCASTAIVFVRCECNINSYRHPKRSFMYSNIGRPAVLQNKGPGFMHHKKVKFSMEALWNAM